MKKAKFLLILIAASAISAGALAYKVRQRAGNFFYVNNASFKCILVSMMNYQVDLAGTSTIYAATQSLSYACPIITVRPYL